MTLTPVQETAYRVRQATDGHLEFLCVRHQHWIRARAPYVRRVVVVDAFGETPELCFSARPDGPWIPCSGTDAAEVT